MPKLLVTGELRVVVVANSSRVEKVALVMMLCWGAPVVMGHCRKCVKIACFPIFEKPDPCLSLAGKLLFNHGGGCKEAFVWQEVSAGLRRLLWRRFLHH